MALRGIQEYIARDANNIARFEDDCNIVSIEKEPSNIIIIHTGLCVSSYYLIRVTASCHFVCSQKIACGVRACLQWNPSYEVTPFASEKWPYKRGA